MPSILRTITEPQDIYILGTCPNDTQNEDCTIMGITDDYSTIDFYAGDTKLLGGFDNVGFLYIMDKPQLEAMKQRIIDDDMYLEHAGLEYDTELPERTQWQTKYGVILRNFSGNIEASLVNEEDGRCYLNHYDVEKDCYLFEHRDEDYDDDIDLEDRIILPEGSVVEECHIYDILDELNGKEYMNTPDLTTVEQFYDVIVNYNKHHNFISDFDYKIYKPYFLGYVAGKGYEEIASEHQETYRLGGKDMKKTHGYVRPLFLGDITDDLKKVGVDLDLFMAKFFFATKTYRDRFNWFYKPLLRPRDRTYELTDD